MKLFSFYTPFTRSWFPFLNLRSIRMLNQATARSEEVHPWSTSVEDTYLVKLHVRALEKENRMVCLCAKDATKNIVFFQVVVLWFISMTLFFSSIMSNTGTNGREIFKMTRILCRGEYRLRKFPIPIPFSYSHFYQTSDLPRIYQV